MDRLGKSVKVGIRMRLSAPLMVVVGAAAIGLSSCGYLIHGTNEKIQITSEPPGATVAMSNGQTAVTPFTATIARNENIAFHISKEGYEPVDITDHANPQWWIWVLDFLPEVAHVDVGTVDSMTGADCSHDTDEITARLTPMPEASPAGALLPAESVASSSAN